MQISKSCMEISEFSYKMEMWTTDRSILKIVCNIVGNKLYSSITVEQY